MANLLKPIGYLNETVGDVEIPSGVPEGEGSEWFAEAARFGREALTAILKKHPDGPKTQGGDYQWTRAAWSYLVMRSISSTLWDGRNEALEMSIQQLFIQHHGSEASRYFKASRGTPWTPAEILDILAGKGKA